MITNDKYVVMAWHCYIMQKSKKSYHYLNWFDTIDILMFTQLRELPCNACVKPLLHLNSTYISSMILRCFNVHIECIFVSLFLSKIAQNYFNITGHVLRDSFKCDFHILFEQSNERNFNAFYELKISKIFTI